MSEQKQSSFMAELDAWTQEFIIDPLMNEVADVASLELNLQVKKAIRQKVLESYHNGQAAGPAKPRRSAPRQ